MFGKYSFTNLIAICKRNKPMVRKYLNRQCRSIEKFEDEDEDSDTIVCTKAESIPIWIVIFFIIIHLILFAWAVYIIMFKWKSMPEWAKSVSIICLVLNLPIFSLIFVYASTVNLDESSTAKTTE